MDVFRKQMVVNRSNLLSSLNFMFYLHFLPKTSIFSSFFMPQQLICKNITIFNFFFCYYFFRLFILGIATLQSSHQILLNFEFSILFFDLQDESEDLLQNFDQIGSAFKFFKILKWQQQNLSTQITMEQKNQDNEKTTISHNKKVPQKDLPLVSSEKRFRRKPIKAIDEEYIPYNVKKPKRMSAAQLLFSFITNLNKKASLSNLSMHAIQSANSQHSLTKPANPQKRQKLESQVLSEFPSSTRLEKSEIGPDLIEKSSARKRSRNKPERIHTSE